MESEFTALDNVEIKEEEESLSGEVLLCAICLKIISSNGNCSSGRGVPIPFPIEQQCNNKVDRYLYNRFIDFCVQYLKLDVTLARRSLLINVNNNILDMERTTSENYFCKSCEQVVRGTLNIFAELNNVKTKLLGNVNELGLIISQSVKRGTESHCVSDEVLSFLEQLENKCFTKAQIIQPSVQLIMPEIELGQIKQKLLSVCKQQNSISSFEDYNNSDDDHDDSQRRVRLPRKCSSGSSTSKKDSKCLESRKNKRRCATKFISSKKARDEPNGTRKDSPRSHYFYNCSECKLKFRKRTSFLAHNLTVHEGLDLKTFLVCGVCLESRKDIIDLQKHLKNEHESTTDKNIFCVHCSDSFVTEQQRDLHRLLDHSKYPHILCEVDDCNEKYFSVCDYSEHLKSHAFLHNTVHCCNQCGRGFLEMNYCELHKLLHITKDDQGFVVCPVQECLKSNKHRTVDKLINHYNMTHLGAQDQLVLHRCELCKSRHFFMFRKELSVHQRLNHARELQCQHCGVNFMGHNALSVHQFNKHPDEFKGNLISSQRQTGIIDSVEDPQTDDNCMEPCNTTPDSIIDTKLEQALYRTCPYCSKNFRTFQEMEKHKATEHKIHNGNMPVQVQCDICGMTLSKAQLSRHKLTHTEPQLPCPYPPCPRKFRREENLIMHIKKLHDRKESDREFVCDACAKRFLTLGLLNRHIKEQHNRHHSCHLCSKKFSTMVRVNEHLRACHTNEKFQCQWCPSQYSWLTKLKTHARKKHKEQAHLLKFIYSYSTKKKTDKLTITKSKPITLTDVDS